MLFILKRSFRTKLKMMHFCTKCKRGFLLSQRKRCWSCFKVKVAQSCPTLCDPWTIAHQAPLSMGFSRQEYWTWGQSLILAGNEIHYCTLMGTLFKDHSKKIILSLGMWHIVTTHIGSWVYTSKAVQLHPIYLIFVHQFSCLHNSNNINPTVLL